MKLIVGLGNPGEKYRKTRHNLGFMVVEHFLKDFEEAKKTVWENQVKFKSDIAVIDWQPKHSSLERIILVKPKTYMNNSGIAVNLLASYYKIPPADIWVVNDDIDLPLGTIKIRFGGASAGHKGVESIIGSLGTDKFWRFRIGIKTLSVHDKTNYQEDGDTHEKLKIKDKIIKKIDNYVVGDFSRQEMGKVREIIKRGAKAIEVSLEEGLEFAMNRFNTK